MWSSMIQVYDGPKVISNDSMEFDDSIFQKYLMIPHVMYTLAETQLMYYR